MLPVGALPSWGFFPPPSQVAFMEVWLTLLLLTVFTLGSLIWLGVSAFCTLLLPLLFIIVVLLVGTLDFIVWLDGTLVLLFRTFLPSFFSYFWTYLDFSSFTFSASRSATVFAIFLICCCLLFRQPRKLTFLTPFLMRLLFL